MLTGQTGLVAGPAIASELKAQGQLTCRLYPHLANQLNSNILYKCSRIYIALYGVWLNKCVVLS